MPKNVELLDNANDILYPRTLAVQVAVTSNQTLDQKLNDVDTKIKNVTDEVTNARTAVGGQAYPNLKARIDAIETVSSSANTTVNNIKAEVEAARGGEQNLKDRLDKMTTATTNSQNTATQAKQTANTANNTATQAQQTANTANNTATQAQQTANTANNTANDVRQEINDAKTPNATLKDKLDGIDNKFGGYLPLTGGTLTGKLNANGGVDVNGNPVWHSGNFNPSTKRDNTHPGLGQWHQGTPVVQNDGVMDIGSIIDFHASHNGQTDYDVRVKSVGGDRLELTGTLIPDGDGHRYLGTTAQKWNSVWATNGTIQTSDERYKGDIQDIDDELFFDMVKGTSVNTYVMLNKRKDIMTLELLEDEENKQDTASPERVQVGIIAQDMAQFDCSKYILVHDEESDIYSINNYNLTSALMAALKVEIAKREELEKRVEALENLIAQAQ